MPKESKEKILKKGRKAPGFVLQDSRKREVSLDDFKEKWVVLYFYPKDNTPGCTIEARDFSKLKRKFAANNAVVLGISKDSCASHASFIKKRKLTVQLLSDPETDVQKKYGVWRKKSFMGRRFMGTARVTVLINPQGKIATIWDPVKVLGHAEDVLETVKELSGK